MSQVPRLPNLAEEAMLAKAVADAGGMGGYSLEEARELVCNSWVAVFDDYMPDGPGYCGKVAVVVWPGGVDLVETFVFRTAADSSRPLEAEYAARAA
jgi:hypothetical protein